MCKQQMRLAYSAVYHKKLKIIKLEWLRYANLFFISSLLEHFTAECTIFSYMLLMQPYHYANALVLNNLNKRVLSSFRILVRLKLHL